MNHIHLLIFALFYSLSVSATPILKYYRISLKDKPSASHILSDSSSHLLSARALERRSRQHISLDTLDVPVESAYIKDLQTAGAQIKQTSRWANSVLVMADSITALRLSQLPFVVQIKAVGSVSNTPKIIGSRDDIHLTSVKTDSPYGRAEFQTLMIHADSLHQLGFRGKGIQIAIMDAGFHNADKLKALRKLNLLGTKDFAGYPDNTFAGHYHGMQVLSCMAADQPHVMVGTAPQAGFWLFRTENSKAEEPVEEDYWVAAAEYADSVGVDIINTSLGYYDFDDKSNNYKRWQLDGKTSLMSRAASIAANKGILVVCSAGNTGTDYWKKITPPADAEGIITVGALTTEGVNADFSAIGNTADGRIKPELMALGSQVAIASTEGNIIMGNGTSFAAPILCGAMACLWQACPWLSKKQLIDVVIRSASQYQHPDNVMGYGIPDFRLAYRYALQLKQ